MQWTIERDGGEQVRSSAHASGSHEYLEKILAWFDDHDLDWRNAIHSDPTGKTIGTWDIPKLKRSPEAIKKNDNT